MSYPSSCSIVGCPDEAYIYGPDNFQLCRTHYDELEALNRAIDIEETMRRGGAKKQTCPRRMSDWGSWKREEDLDQWSVRDGHMSCSFCGSLEPETVLQLLRDGAEAGPTDKGYKMYVHFSDRGQGKFYFQHFSPEQCQEFIDMLNARTMKIGYPGHFYRRPFFIAAPNS